MAGPVSPRRLLGVGAAASILLAAGVLALAPALSASAHDYLVSSTPAAGSTQTAALSKVVLTFDDRVLDLSGDGSSNVVEVTHDSKHFESGCPTIADTDVTVPVSLGGSGRYTVTWQIVSADGHTVSSSMAFDYAKPQDATAAEGGASRPTCGDQASARAEPSSSASGAGSGSGSGSSGSSVTGSSGSVDSSSSSGGLPVALGVGGGIIVVALAAVAVVLLKSRAAAAAAAPPRADGQRTQPKRSGRSRRTPPPPPGD